MPASPFPVLSRHLLEQGSDLRYIHALLPHSSSQPTELHTHLTQHELGKIINPLGR